MTATVLRFPFDGCQCRPARENRHSHPIAESHIRSRDAQHSGASNSTVADQLELPLFRENHLNIICMENMHGRKFLANIKALRPNIILDIRHFPRFDLIGLGREEAFIAINHYSNNYISRPMALHDIILAPVRYDLSALLGSVANYLVDSKINFNGDTAILVQEGDHARLLSIYISSATCKLGIKPWAGYKISILH